MKHYLDKIQFNPKEYSKALTTYVTNMRVVVLLLVALILGGLTSYFTLPRTLNPEIDITIVVVSTVLPGATPEDVEELLTTPLEDEIQKVDDIDMLTSASRESASVIVIQFLDNAEQGRAINDVQNAVNRVSNLPEDATNPIVDIVDFEDMPIARYALTGDTDQASLNRYALNLQESLEDHPLIDRVDIFGDEQQEVQVLLSEEKMTALNVDTFSFARSIATAVGSYPAGSVESDSTSFGLTVDRTLHSLDDVRNLSVMIQGSRYALGDIATITERNVPSVVPAYLTQPEGETKRAVTLSVYRVMDSKITDASVAIESVLKKEYGEDEQKRFHLAEIENMSQMIQDQFSDLFRNLATTVSLVFVTLLLFIGVRQALVAALSIPLVFMAAFIAMQVSGISLNFLSAFSLLLSLGLLVDVTIVIVSAITSYHRSGKFTSKQTGLLVWKDFLVTLTVTTLTTVWAFIPLLLAGGIIGEFIKPIPVIVSAMLASSVVIGFLIILPLMVWLLEISLPRRVKILFSIIFFVGTIVGFLGILSIFGISIPGWMWIILVPVFLFFITAFVFSVRKAGKNLKKFIHKHFCKAEEVSEECIAQGIIGTKKIEELYRKLLSSVVSTRSRRRKAVAMVVIFFIFSFALVPAGFVKNEFFPGDDFDVTYVTVELPRGTSSEKTRVVARDFVQNFTNIPGVKRIQTQIGAGLDEQGAPTGQRGSHAVLYTIQLFDRDDRELSSQEISQYIRDLEAVRRFDQGIIQVAEITGGPPAGADVTLKLIGDDLIELDRLAEKTIQYLKEQEGVINPKKSIETGTAKIVFESDTEKITELGLTDADIGFFLRTYASGFTLDDDVVFDESGEKRDIVLRSSAVTQDITSLGALQIPLPSGDRMALSSLGSYVLKPNPTVITHEDADRMLSVTAAVTEGYNAQEINVRLGEFADTDLELPKGYRWETGGANEENNKSVQSILQAMLLAFMLIFLTLIIRLNSYRKSFIVLLVIPLAISGVFIVFALTGLPLSFPSLIGILALFGIVINNSIIIIDQINKNHRMGLSFHDSVVDGAASRLEPILLSSLTTIIGLTPITLSEPVWQGLGGAIISGLIFSGMIMLFFIPVVYYMWFEREYCDAKHYES